jgi:hypothetical protein
MTKTSQQVVNDFYFMVKGSPLASLINGKVYKYKTRPRDSKKEDAVIRFVTGRDAQVQSGTVVVNIFVPDVDHEDNGVLAPDITRCTEIEIVANTWVKSLTVDKTGEYKISFSQTISTEEEPEIDQHFVSVRLRFRLTTF